MENQKEIEELEKALAAWSSVWGRAFTEEGLENAEKMIRQIERKLKKLKS